MARTTTPTKARLTVADVAKGQLALSERLDALTSLVERLVEQPAAPAESPAEPKAPRKTRQPKAAASKWHKGVRFTYVKKNGAESTFRVTEVQGRRAKVRNEGTGFTSNFKLTTLDALLQAGNVKDVR